MAASYPRQNSLDNISYTPSFIFPLGDSSTELGSTSFGQVSNFDPNYTPRLYQFALKAQF